MTVPERGRALHVATAGGADAELAADALWQAGAVAVEERRAGDGVLLVAALTDGAEPGPLVAAVGGRWPAEVVAVDVGAALDAWRAHARPVTVGRLTARPPWLPPSAGGAGPSGGGAGPSAGGAGPSAGGAGPAAAGGPIELVVDPGRAFGSGSHPSTRLALRALGELVSGSERVLDVGCGSGVLALAALALGARHATACDIDPEALSATRANAERNDLADRLVVAGPPAPIDHRGPGAAGTGGRTTPGVQEAGDRASGPYDLVVANILAPTLVELSGAIAARLAPHGAVVLSGFLTEREPGVRAAYPDLTPVARHDEDGWSALVLRQ